MTLLTFEFATATRIILGAGAFETTGKLAAELGGRVLVTAGTDLNRSRPLLNALAAAGVASTLYPVDGEPTLKLIADGVEIARTFGCDLVIGFGGGSAIDAGKAIAALATNPGETLDYLEVVGRGRALENPPLACIAIPTTAGTGAEVTRNSVIGVPEHSVKVSLRSPLMLPKLALVDPELTYSLPPDVTASTGLDALTQLIEPFTSNRPNPLVDALCREGIPRAARALPRAYHDGGNASAREGMSLASLFGGLALANAKLGGVHGFAGVLGGMIAAPHGAICARLLPFVTEQNVTVLRLREPQHMALERYREIARMLTGDPQATIEAGVAWLHKLIEALHIPSLGSYGLNPADFGTVVEKSARASSMQGNPVKLTEEEMREILELAF